MMMEKVSIFWIGRKGGKLPQNADKGSSISEFKVRLNEQCGNIETLINLLSTSEQLWLDVDDI